MTTKRESALFHKQLPSREPWFSNNLSWCLKEVKDTSFKILWEQVSCGDCNQIKRMSENQQHPLHAWYLIENCRDFKLKISKPQDVQPLFVEYIDCPQEHFIVITLNGSNEVISRQTVTIGLVNQTQVHPREVFSLAIKDRAVSIIVGHNHPSGCLEPSAEDLYITEQLTKAGDLIGIDLLDHVIVSEKGLYSFLEHGEI